VKLIKKLYKKTLEGGISIDFTVCDQENLRGLNTQILTKINQTAQ
jgi:hypothetical protein